MRKNLLSLSIFLLLLINVQAAAQTIVISPTIDSLPKGYLCHRTTGRITIDGKLNEDSWRNVPWTDDFVDIQGGSKPNPRFRTRVKMLWDDSSLYIGAEFEEPHVWANLRQRDTVIFYDNDFEVFMDPNGDNIEYYEMEMNALNTVWDLFLPIPYKDGGSAVDSWNIAGLRTAVHITGTLNNPNDTDKGWSVEIAMPWSSLKEYSHRPAPPEEGDTWRINFSRVEWQTEISGGAYHKIKGKPEDNWVWSPQGVIDMHRPEMWGYIQFTKLRSGESQYHPDPFAVERRTLMKLYYAERVYHEKNHRYTQDINELSFGNVTGSLQELNPVIHLTPEGYLITVNQIGNSHTIGKWHIRQDSKIWNSGE
ncbi:MAG: carbohydrate-binding family 9-like protein [Bacteroidota bacterium]